jgi:hypothetical protein
MKLSTEHLTLGLAALALIVPFTKGDNDQIYRLSSEAIRSARGTNICISWDCRGSAMPDQPDQPSLPAQQPGTVLTLTPIEPGTRYQDVNGTDLPVYEINGQHYLATAK